MTSQFITTDASTEAGFQAWHYHHPKLGRASILLENGIETLRCVLDSEPVSLVVEFQKTSAQSLSVTNWHVNSAQATGDLARLSGLALLDVLFSRHPSLQYVVCRCGIDGLLPAVLLNDQKLERAAFYQWPELWCVGGFNYPVPAVWQQTGDVYHPQRAPQPRGEFYRRYVSSINKTLSLRAVDPEQEDQLDLFHDWMNHPRIAPIWELGLPKNELKDYLRGRIQDPHIMSVFGYFDDEPLGYFELYWTPEDRLGPYYKPQPFDRGIHLLVGNPKFLGTQFFEAWFTGVTHYLFLDDPRTLNIMGEPRADNKALLKHLKTIPAFRFIKEFDFPHKRAALLGCKREDFFHEMVLP